MNKNMKKLFTGKFRGIPVALLTIALLLTIGAGVVTAATNGGYVLWEGTVEVSVREPITFTHGPAEDNCGTPLDPGHTFTVPNLNAGDCWERFFKTTSAIENPLLIKAYTEWWYDGGWTETPPDWATVAWYDSEGVEIDPAEWPVSSEDDPPTITSVRVCVDGNSGLHEFSIRITFTRQSPE